MTNETGQMTLAQLINDRRGNRTYKQLSDDCGGQPTEKRLSSITLKGINAFPDPATISGLAIGLGVTTSEVIDAAARSIGFIIRDDAGTMVLPEAGNLPSSMQEAIRSVVREYLKQQSNVRKPYMNAGATGLTDYQAELRQSFSHYARLRRVPATAIEQALAAAAWGSLQPDDERSNVLSAVLGWYSGPDTRQLQAALSDALTSDVAEPTQADHALAADHGDPNVGPEEIEHDT